MTAKPDGRAGKNRCVCGHLEVRHDMFGCKTCELLGRVCNEFRSRAKYMQRCAVCNHIPSRHNPKCETCKHHGEECLEYVAPTRLTSGDNTFFNEVRRQGFIHHSGELATCTVCWQVIKVGFSNSVTSVINAKAHKLKCNEHKRHVG